jgi:hypothetical protein
MNTRRRIPYNLWSGRVVDRDHVMFTPHYTDGATYLIMDVARGTLPGTLRWDDRLGDYPIGWAFVARDAPSCVDIIGRRWYALPLRFGYRLREYWLWFVAVRYFVRDWWRARPPAR